MATTHEKLVASRPNPVALVTTRVRTLSPVFSFCVVPDVDFVSMVKLLITKIKHFQHILCHVAANKSLPL